MDMTMAITVSSGVTSSGLTISSGDPLIVNSGGVAEDIIINAGGSATLLAGAVGSAFTVSAGAMVTGAGLLDGVSVLGSLSGVGLKGRDNTVLAGGVATNVDVVHADLNIDKGAKAAGTSVSDKGLFAVGGTASDSLIGEGSEEEVLGGVAFGDTIEKGGMLVTDTQASLTGETVLNGGTIVYYGNVTTGTALPGVILSTGAIVDLSGDVVSNGVVLNLAGVNADYLDVLSGGEVLGPGNLIGSVTVAGTISGVTDEGVVKLVSGGIALEINVLDQVLRVSAGAAATNTLLSYFGTEYVYSGGIAIDTTVGSGSLVRVGGTTSGTTVDSRGDEQVFSGGVDHGMVVNSGGSAVISSGGNALDMSLQAGGEAVISSGGVALDISVLLGGSLTVDGEVRIGGNANLAGTLSGGGAIVETGGGDLLLDGQGGTFAGKAAISGGAIELATAGALGSGGVAFSAPSTGSAVLQIDAADAPAAGGTFANRISNFSATGEAIDLRGLAYVDGATATLTGSTLVLTDGGGTYAFNLKGTAAAYSVTSDGHGGTVIDAGAALFVQAAAAFAPVHAAKTATLPAASPSTLTPVLHAAASSGLTYF
jgi:autotransporter passenger strand-loop-strand repeat protein